MLGPLPRIYRYIVSAIAVAVFMAGGAWAAYVLPSPILLRAGAGVGLAVGGLAAFALLHQFRAAPLARPAHVPARRPHRR
ncbi:MAG TPA: hypothetical protein VFG88_09900 [Nocardioidaceae bacterium]|nr:hypothetical protein [Nocardioidaceae bacterium]